DRGHCLVDARELLERAELRQLRDELRVRLRLGGVLVLKLRHEQLEKRIDAERADARVRVLRRGGRGGPCGRRRRCCGINTHVPTLLPRSVSRAAAWRADRGPSFPRG